jgi:glycosyltransferase involved in cell wall biosynthesis
VRLVYVTETFPPEINGVALTAERALHALRAQGHEVLLLRPRQRGEPPRDDAREWRSAGAPLPMYPELRFGLARAASLRKRFVRERPALVHAATPGPLAWAALRAARSLGVATSSDFRTRFDAYCSSYRAAWAQPLAMAWLRRLNTLSDRTFVPTAELARELSCVHRFQRLAISARGVDTQRFSPSHRGTALRAQWGVSEDDPVLIYVGRLAPEKNVLLALDGFERLRARVPRAVMVVVGDGPSRAALQARHPGVVFTGALSGDALARHYASADVFAFPSRTDTFGNVVLEALASGLAVVAFDTAAAAVHIRHRDSGWLVPTAVPARFAAALHDVLHHAAPGSPLRSRARQAAELASWSRVLEDFERQLLDVVQTPQRRERARTAPEPA